MISHLAYTDAIKNLGQVKITTFLRIICIGYIDEVKNQCRAIDFASVILDKHPGLRLAIHFYGRKKSERYFSRFIAKVDEFNKRYSASSAAYFGYQNSCNINIGSYHFSLLTSTTESQPLSIVESMYSGTPSIAPAVGGIPDLLSQGIGVAYKNANSQNILPDEVERFLLMPFRDREQYLELCHRNIRMSYLRYSSRQFFSEYDRLFNGKL